VKAGHSLAGPTPYLRRIKMFAGVLKDFADDRALMGHADAVGSKLAEERIGLFCVFRESHVSCE